MWLILTCTCFQSEPASLRSTCDWYLLVLVSGPSLHPSVPHVIDTYLYLFPVRACIPPFTCDWYLLVLVSSPCLRPSIPHVIDTYLYLFLVRACVSEFHMWLILTCTCFWSEPASLSSHVINTYLYLFAVRACVPLFHMWLILTCTCFWSEPASLHSTCDWYLVVLVSGPILRPSVPHVIDTYLYLFLVWACVSPFHMWLILTCTCFWSEPASLSSHVIDTYLYLFAVRACVPPFHMWLILTCTCFRSEPASLRSTCDQTPRRRRTCRVLRPLPGTTTQSCPPAAKQPFKINCTTPWCKMLIYSWLNPLLIQEGIQIGWIPPADPLFVH